MPKPHDKCVTQSVTYRMGDAALGCTSVFGAAERLQMTASGVNPRAATRRTRKLRSNDSRTDRNQ